MEFLTDYPNAKRLLVRPSPRPLSIVEPDERPSIAHGNVGAGSPSEIPDLNAGIRNTSQCDGNASNIDCFHRNETAVNFEDWDDHGSIDLPYHTAGNSTTSSHPSSSGVSIDPDGDDESVYGRLQDLNEELDDEDIAQSRYTRGKRNRELDSGVMSEQFYQLLDSAVVQWCEFSR